MGMMENNLQNNLRLIFSYGKSVSDICRKGQFNRTQVNKYLNGYSVPTLATLRRICDFFGLEDHEIHLPHQEFAAIIRLRPPKLGVVQTLFESNVDNIADASESGSALLEQYEGYYHSYANTSPEEGRMVRSLIRIYRENNKWVTRSIDRKLNETFRVPAMTKYRGFATEAFNSITVYEREQGAGRSLWVYMLYGAVNMSPDYLIGLQMSTDIEVPHEIQCIRTVWKYLGRKPNLREALGQCGIVDTDRETVPDIVVEGINNAHRENEFGFSPRV
ncbi:MAG: helix-turn-helix transcriptional regulator [Sulfitobacter sp.]